MNEVWVVIGTDSGSDQTHIVGVCKDQSRADWLASTEEATQFGPAYWEKWSVQ